MATEMAVVLNNGLIGQWHGLVTGCLLMGRQCCSPPHQRGTLMRHFFIAGVLRAARTITTLALGVTVPPTSSSLVALAGGPNAGAPCRRRTAGTAVALPPIAARADQHLAAASGTHKQPSIVHRTSNAMKCWTTQPCAAILGIDPCASADRGAAPDLIAKSNWVRGCVGFIADANFTPNLPTGSHLP